MNNQPQLQSPITARRYHDISCGHRVHGHESKCAHLHGHNYRVHFTVAAKQGYQSVDGLGRVLDFSVIKSELCMWLEENWDHKFLAWDQDSYMKGIYEDLGMHSAMDAHQIMFADSIVWVPFNPTAENMAMYLVEEIGPQQLAGTAVELIEVTIEETAKCWATYTKPFARRESL